VLTFLALKRILAATRYDRVYIYNGRWSMMRSAVRACEQLGVAFYTHERGSDCHKFALYPGALPHDRARWRQRVQAAWESAAEDPGRLACAEAFFHDRRQRVEKSWFSHTKQQESGRVPADWERPARRIVYFTSSEFECAAIDDGPQNRIYPNQSAGLPRLARRLAAADPSAHLWVRVHPNDQASAPLWTHAAAGLTNVTLIPPDARIDSYALLDGADRVLTFGSTMGIEATYWGKISICADYGYYDGLDALYEPASEAELVDLLTRADVRPKPCKHALPFGYYINTHGEDFSHFSTEKISDYDFRSPFRGRCLKPDYDDLRERVRSLHQQGESRRAAALAASCLRFAPDDVTMHSIRVASLLRLQAAEPAVNALEAAAVHVAPAHLEALLKLTAKPLLDVVLQFSKRAAPDAFQSVASRAGQVMRRVPAFAPIGDKLVAIATRANAAQAA
jgi:hypothetical protein